MNIHEAKKTGMKQTPVLSTGVETIASAVLTVPTKGEGFIDITAQVAQFLQQTGGTTGAISLFIRHTSASLTIQENADPDVLADLLTSLRRLAPAEQQDTLMAAGVTPSRARTTCPRISRPC